MFQYISEKIRSCMFFENPKLLLVLRQCGRFHPQILHNITDVDLSDTT